MKCTTLLRKFLLNQRRETNFVIASFLWASITVHSESKWSAMEIVCPKIGENILLVWGHKTGLWLILIMIIKLRWINIKIEQKLNINICNVTFFIVSAAYLFIVYLFRQRDCKRKVSTHGQLVPIFYFTRLLDRKQITFYNWSYLTLPLALDNFTQFIKAFSGDIYWSRNLWSVKRNVQKIHKYISCLHSLIASFTSIAYLLITGKIINS